VPRPTRQLEIMWCGKVRSETSSNYRQKGEQEKDTAMCSTDMDFIRDLQKETDGC